MNTDSKRRWPGQVLFLDMAGEGMGLGVGRILEDAAETLQAGCESCRLEGVSATVAARELRSRLSEGHYLAVVIAMPIGLRMGLLEELGPVWREWPGTPILLIWRTVCIEEIESAWQLGAPEFCVMPALPAEIVFRLKRMIRCGIGEEDAGIRSLKEQLGLRQIIGQSPAIADTLRRLPVLARSGATLLIRGETGTGKEVFARAIHYLSHRSQSSFVPVNCGAIPTELLENELFGHVPGAFTGAGRVREGLVSEARGGTLFLDEVDALPPSAQVKLLRLLQEREYRPLGSSRRCEADVRVLAASNADLRQSMRDGRFRHDLYYRLDVLSIRLPPLRDRANDVLLLSAHFLRKFRQLYGKPVLELSLDARRKLLAHDWPGNVRELENVIERATILASHDVIRAEHVDLPGESDSMELVGFRQAKARMVSQFERDYLHQVLSLHHGNITRAARTAGKNRRALFELIRKHHVQVRTFASSGGDGSHLDR